MAGQQQKPDQVINNVLQAMQQGGASKWPMQDKAALMTAVRLQLIPAPRPGKRPGRRRRPDRSH